MVIYRSCPQEGPAGDGAGSLQEASGNLENDTGNEKEKQGKKQREKPGGLKEAGRVEGLKLIPKIPK